MLFGCQLRVVPSTRVPHDHPRIHAKNGALRLPMSTWVYRYVSTITFTFQS